MISDTAEYWNDIENYFNRDRSFVKFKKRKRHFNNNGEVLCNAESSSGAPLNKTINKKNVTCKMCQEKLKQEIIRSTK